MQNNEEYYNRSIYTALRLGFIALLLIWSFLIIRPFIMLTLWGIIIAIAIYPFFKKLAKKLGAHEKLAATIITLIGLSFLIIPSVLLIDSTVGSLSDFSDQMAQGTIHIPPPSEDVANWPVIGKPIFDLWNLFATNFKGAIAQFSPQIKAFAPKVFAAASGFGTSLLLFIISIIIAGALFTTAKPAEKAARSIFNTLIGISGTDFVKMSVGIIRSVVQGILGIAVIQSLAGGIGMWAIGIPGAGLWALIILFFAIMQLPPLLILGPIAVYSFSIADTTPDIIFTVWSLVVSMSDAFLKPLLLGRGVDVPMLAVLLGAIGGMIMSGIIGLFVGAVVLAISYKIFEALLVEDVLDKSVNADAKNKKSDINN
jgi:predicted PurR-regulated permease PerM